MSINLSKGGKIDLTKGNPSLKHIMVGLGWDENSYDGQDFDLDASAFVLRNNRCTSDTDFVFYNNLEHPSGAVIHMGDNRTGDAEGDDEQIFVDFSKMPEQIDRVAFVVTIYEAEERRQNFGQVDNAYIRIVNNDSGEEICRFDLTEDYSIETALVVGEIYKHNGDWKFSAVGSGFQGGLAALVRKYGLDA